MAEKASTKNRRKRTAATKPNAFRRTVREQGRSFIWLSRQTGYSESQIGRVARGEHPGSEKFHIAMRQALGEDYAA